jgi:hypothetical protein
VASNKSDEEGVIIISDDKDEDDMSVLTTKTQDELVALLVQARKQIGNATVGSRVASGSDLPPGNGPAVTLSQTNAGGQESTLANSASSGTNGNSIGGDAHSGSGGK